MPSTTYGLREPYRGNIYADPSPFPDPRAERAHLERYRHPWGRRYPPNIQVRVREMSYPVQEIVCYRFETVEERLRLPVPPCILAVLDDGLRLEGAPGSGSVTLRYGSYPLFRMIRSGEWQVCDGARKYYLCPEVWASATAEALEARAAVRLRIHTWESITRYKVPVREQEKAPGVAPGAGRTSVRKGRARPSRAPSRAVGQQR